MTPALDKAIRAGAYEGQLAERQGDFANTYPRAIRAALRSLAEPDEAGIEAAALALAGLRGAILVRDVSAHLVAHQSPRRDEVMAKPILCVDFDGVIHSYSSGWKGATEIPDPPVTGALKWLWNATNWWDVQIYSSRTKELGGITAMSNWLHKHALMEWPEDFVELHFKKAISFPEQKPAAALTIDDRAITFEGVWADLDPERLRQFQPWNKRIIGATGAFPEGRFGEDDEGALRFAVIRDGNIVRLEFGKPVAWLGLPPETAIALGRLLLAKAGEK